MVSYNTAVISAKASYPEAFGHLQDADYQTLEDSEMEDVFWQDTDYEFGTELGTVDREAQDWIRPVWRLERNKQDVQRLRHEIVNITVWLRGLQTRLGPLEHFTRAEDLPKEDPQLCRVPSILARLPKELFNQAFVGLINANATSLT